MSRIRPLNIKGIKSRNIILRKDVEELPQQGSINRSNLHIKKRVTFYFLKKT